MLDGHGCLPLHAAVSQSVANGVAYNEYRHQKCHRDGKDTIRLQLKEIVSLLLKFYPEGSKVLDKDGHLPLHYSLGNMEGKSETFAMLLDAFPKGAEKKNRYGDYPIHMAWADGGSEELKLLVKVYPDGLKQQNKEGNLPIHLACKHGMSEDTLKLLVRIYPDGLEQQNKNGDLPIHMACKRHELAEDELNVLLEHYPAGLKHKDKTGNLPIHHAFAKATLSVTVFQAFVEGYPDGLNIPVGDGNYDSGSFPIHCLLQHPGGLYFEDKLIYLLDNYPGVAKHQDKKGNLPIHIAVTKDTLTKTIKSILERYPDSLKQRNKEGEFPIHRAAEFGSLEAIREIVNADRECLRQENFKRNLAIHLAAVRYRSPALAIFIATNYPKGLMHQNENKNRAINLCGFGGEVMFEFVRLCPESLSGIHNNPVEEYLQNHKFTKKRSLLVGKVIRAAISKPVPKGSSLPNGNNELEANSFRKNEFEQNTNKLKQSHKAEKEQIMQSHADEKKWHIAEKEELQKSLEMYKEMASEGRKIDKSFLSKLLEPEKNASVDELKVFAASLKRRIDLLKAKVTPTAKPSMMQLMFASFIKDPSLEKPSLLGCIESLDAELTGLERDMEEPVSSPARSTTAASLNTSINVGDDESSNDVAGRRAKRPRVSMPWEQGTIEAVGVRSEASIAAIVLTFWWYFHFLKYKDLQ